MPSASIEEIGSTAVPGLPTKGDLDLAIVVEDTADIELARRTLTAILDPHQQADWTNTYISFVSRPDDPDPAGIVVVVSGSTEDAEFRGFRDHLLADDSLCSRYSELKRRHDGGSMDIYRAAKHHFIIESMYGTDLS